MGCRNRRDERGGDTAERCKQGSAGSIEDGGAMSNVKAMPGVRNPEALPTPNDGLIGAIRQLLAMAESGQLQSYIGTGFTYDGLRVATWGDHHDDTYQMLGSLAWLQAEYVSRHTN
jgi:hypothetical protein